MRGPGGAQMTQIWFDLGLAWVSWEPLLDL